MNENCFEYQNLKYCYENNEKTTLCLGDSTGNHYNAIDDYDLFKEELVIPEKVLSKEITKIGQHAFEQCAKLRFVKIYANIECIESYAFNQCQNLEYINIPSSVVSIGGNALCVSKINDGTKSSGTLFIAFQQNSNLQKLNSGAIAQKENVIITFCDEKTINDCSDDVFLSIDNVILYSKHGNDICPSVSKKIISGSNQYLCSMLYPTLIFITLNKSSFNIHLLNAFLFVFICKL